MQTEKTAIISSFAPAVAITFLVVAMLGSCVNPSLLAPKAHNGHIDLSGWSFANRGAMRLDGEWEFFAGELVPPQSHDTFAKTPFVVIPDSGLWQNVKSGPHHLSPYGYATYRLKMTFADGQDGLTLKIPELFSAGRIFLNGKEIYSAGTVGMTPDTTHPQYRTGIVSITPKAGENELVMQVANFAERRGGINRSIFIGNERSIQLLYIKSLAMDLIIFGSLLTIGIYHLCLFWLRRKDRSLLWFGVFCIIIALRSLIYGERFIFNLFPDIPWEVFNRIDHLTFYLGIPIFSAYIAHIFDRDISRVAIHIYQALGLAFALCLLFPPIVFNRTVSIYEIITGGYALYTLVVIVRALMRKREGALTTVIGIGIFLCFGVNEILFNMGLINTFNSLSIGLVLFLFTQAILLAMRSSKAFAESEHLGKTLLSRNASLRRFIPQEFFLLLHRKEVDEIMLGDQVEQNMTIMFCDIRHFTSFAEQLDAARTLKFLNDYFGRVGEVIRKNGGFIDKYLGDGFIALFPGSPDEALKAAIGIQRAVCEFNKSREKESMPPVSVGIGLNFGTLILGTVGEEHRMDTTVIADSVNLCSRLEGLTKLYGKGVIVPFEFLDRLTNPDMYHWRYLGLIRVQGRKQPVELVHIFDGLPDKDFARFAATKDRFEEALHVYRNGEYEKAMEEFRLLATEDPDDPALFTFITLIHRLIVSGLAEDWDGIDNALGK